MIADLDGNISKIVKTVSSDNNYSVKAVDPQNKKKKEEERRRITWRNGHILESVKLLPFILIIDVTPKQHNNATGKFFYQSLKRIKLVLKHTLRVF